MEAERNEANEGLESDVSDDAATDCVVEQESGAGEGGCRVPGKDTAQKPR